MPDNEERAGNRLRRPATAPTPAKATRLAAVSSRGEPDSAQSSLAEHAGGVQPDHVVTMNEEQWAAWTKWRHEQDLPDPSPGAGLPVAVDLQLDKAMKLLRSILKREPTG
jgi:hypothetical protein